MAKAARKIIDRISDYRGDKRMRAYAAGNIPATQVIKAPKGKPKTRNVKRG